MAGRRVVRKAVERKEGSKSMGDKSIGAKKIGVITILQRPQATKDPEVVQKHETATTTTKDAEIVQRHVNSKDAIITRRHERMKDMKILQRPQTAKDLTILRRPQTAAKDFTILRRPQAAANDVTILRRPSTAKDVAILKRPQETEDVTILETHMTKEEAKQMTLEPQLLPDELPRTPEPLITKEGDTPKTVAAYTAKEEESQANDLATETVGEVESECVASSMKKNSPSTPTHRERWAGPAYTNSPPPSTLPFPKFPMQRLRSVLTAEDVEFEEAKPIIKSLSAPTSPSEGSSTKPSSYLDATSATKDLRRLLNLDTQADLEDESILDDDATQGLKKILQLG